MANGSALLAGPEKSTLHLMQKPNVVIHHGVDSIGVSNEMSTKTVKEGQG